MKPPQPRQRLLLVLLGLTLVTCGEVARAQVPNAQTQNPATAQKPAESTVQPPVQPAARTVRLNVMVIDESNRSVGGLRQEDFRVEEDGAPQVITHFAREETPVSYALVVDNSGSLRSHLNTILMAGAALVSANRPGDETTLTRFVSSDNITVVRDFTDNQPALVDGLASMYVEGGQTALIDAVYLSAERVGERRRDEGAPRRRALVLLTDGEDRMSYYKQSELQTLLRKHDVQVFAVGIVAILSNEGGFRSKSSRSKASDFLNGLAQETGGRAFFPRNVTELQDAINQIARDMRTQYVIGYQPSNANRDGKFRKIQVKLGETAAGGKRTVHARSGYLAPGAKAEEKKDSKEKRPRPKSP